MEISAFNTLPIILVSAKDQVSANSVIYKINDNKQEISIGDNYENIPKHVWKLVNKYYTADVRFHILSDGEKLSSEVEDLIEGHIIYLTEAETTDKIAMEMIKRRMLHDKSADVRVIVADCESEESSLLSFAALHHYELIPLRAAADPESAEPAGLDRVRAAFHAHVWSGMQTHHQSSLSAIIGRDSDSDSDSWSSWQGADEEREDEMDEQWVERAEAFAAALGALPEAVAGVRAANGNRTARIARAELVLAAFCDALGDPLHLPDDRFDREL